MRMRCYCGVVKSFFYLSAYTYDFCICVRGLANSRRTATHKSFSFEAEKNKGGYCIGTSQIFGSKCTVSTPLKGIFF